MYELDTFAIYIPTYHLTTIIESISVKQTDWIIFNHKNHPRSEYDTDGDNDDEKQINDDDENNNDDNNGDCGPV